MTIHFFRFGWKKEWRGTGKTIRVNATLNAKKKCEEKNCLEQIETSFAVVPYPKPPRELDSRWRTVICFLSCCSSTNSSHLFTFACSFCCASWLCMLFWVSVVAIVAATIRNAPTLFVCAHMNGSMTELILCSMESFWCIWYDYDENTQCWHASVSVYLSCASSANWRLRACACSILLLLSAGHLSALMKSLSSNVHNGIIFGGSTDSA